MKPSNLNLESLDIPGDAIAGDPFAIVARLPEQPDVLLGATAEAMVIPSIDEIVGCQDEELPDLAEPVDHGGLRRYEIEICSFLEKLSTVIISPNSGKVLRPVPFGSPALRSRLDKSWIIDLDKLENPIAFALEGAWLVIVGGAEPYGQFYFSPATLPEAFELSAPLEDWIGEMEDPWLAKELGLRLGEPYSRLTALALFRRHRTPGAADRRVMAESRGARIPDPAGDFWRGVSAETALEAEAFTASLVSELRASIEEFFEDYSAEERPLESWAPDFLQLCRQREEISALTALLRSRSADPANLSSDLTKLDRNARAIAGSVPSIKAEDELLIRACSIEPGTWWTAPAERWLESQDLDEED